MVLISNDTARCDGDGHIECRDCARAIQGDHDREFGGPYRTSWMTSPGVHPCDLRITVSE